MPTALDRAASPPRQGATMRPSTLKPIIMSTRWESLAGFSSELAKITV
jgi:hypothetical protein